jgi:hypothetical protein
MATKNRKSQVIGDRVIAPELNPRDPDTKYTGGEPLFATQPDPDRRSGAMGMAFNWYSRFYDRKQAKEQLANYCEYRDQPDLARKLRRVDDREIHATMGWLARLYLRGLNLTEEEQGILDNEINRLIVTLAKPEVVEAGAIEVKSNRPSVQEIMRERAHEAAGEMEGWLDDFILAGARGNLEQNPVGPLSERNILPQHVSILVEVWKRKRDQFQEAMDSRDPQIIEAYSHYGKLQLRALVKFCEAVIAGLGSYVNVKKASKAPRKRKAVPVEKIVSKVKFMKTYKDDSGKLELTSVHPAKIVGATEVWAYDTAKRKLHYYVADSHVGTLGVKGTTIMGFDSTKSGVKTVRKPADVLKKFMTAGKPAARKLFGDINAVQAQPNGRTNENLVILKAY